MNVDFVKQTGYNYSSYEVSTEEINALPFGLDEHIK